MDRIRPIPLQRLNSKLVNLSPDRYLGVLDAANLFNSLFAKAIDHPYLPGDCLLFKFNLLKKRQVRKNKFYIKKRPELNPVASPSRIIE